MAGENWLWDFGLICQSPDRPPPTGGIYPTKTREQKFQNLNSAYLPVMLIDYYYLLKNGNRPFSQGHRGKDTSTLWGNNPRRKLYQNTCWTFFFNESEENKRHGLQNTASTTWKELEIMAQNKPTNQGLVAGEITDGISGASELFGEKVYDYLSDFHYSVNNLLYIYIQKPDILWYGCNK